MLIEPQNQRFRRWICIEWRVNKVPDWESCRLCNQFCNVVEFHMNTNNFIFESISIHGDKYDYSQSIYVNAKTKIVIICPTHGEFQQLRKNHKMGKGCNKCAIESRARNNTHTLEKFIEKAQRVHGKKYDYSKSSYLGDDREILVLCGLHGEFTQNASSHLQGIGCPKCGRLKASQSHLLSKEEVLSRSIEIHGDKYDYNQMEYVNTKTKIMIVCPKHGKFRQSPTNHVLGQGCPKCGIETAKSHCSVDTETFIRRSRKTHGDKYDYSKSEYADTKTKIIIICPEHGEFKQLPKNHVNGQGCASCAIDKSRVGLEEFKDRASETHLNRYDYSASKFTNTNEKIGIICPEHGIFKQTVASHLHQCCGCPTCNISNIHLAVIDMIPDGIQHTTNDRSVLNGLEIDSYFPEHKFGIEIHGEYYHGLRNNNVDGYKRLKNLNQNKSIAAEEAGIKLYQFWGDEITNKPALVKSMILNALGRSKPQYARKLEIKSLSNREVSGFFNENHLQGHRNAKVNLALTRDDDVVSCLTLSKHLKYGWEIIRYANKSGTTVVGGFTRLLKHFIKTQKPEFIMTYADRRYSIGSIYLLNGFKLIDITKPGYFYWKNGQSLSRQKCQKNKLRKLLPVYSEKLSETDNMLSNGFVKVFDAGHQKLMLTI